MSKAIDAGKAFLAGVLAKLPAEQRAQAETLFADQADALTVLGSGALGQAEINRKFNEVEELTRKAQEDYDRLQTWYTERQTQLADYEKIKPEYDRLKGTVTPPPVVVPPLVDPEKFISRDDFVKEMQHQQLSAANYLALMTKLAGEHFKTFGEVLDGQELLGDKSLGKTLPDGRTYGIVDAYRTKYAEQLTARQTADEQARIDKLVGERLAEERKKSPHLPFPVREGASPLDLLEPAAPAKPSDFTADSALALYNELQEKRLAAAG
jgi:hypothetical protein